MADWLLKTLFVLFICTVEFILGLCKNFLGWTARTLWLLSDSVTSSVWLPVTIGWTLMIVGFDLFTFGEISEQLQARLNESVNDLLKNNPQLAANIVASEGCRQFEGIVLCLHGTGWKILHHPYLEICWSCENIVAELTKFWQLFCTWKLQHLKTYISHIHCHQCWQFWSCLSYGQVWKLAPRHRRTVCTESVVPILNSNLVKLNDIVLYCTVGLNMWGCRTYS